MVAAAVAWAKAPWALTRSGHAAYGLQTDSILQPQSNDGNSRLQPGRFEFNQSPWMPW
jgi:hypothetical protein